MELLIAGGIALLGYNMSSATPPPRSATAKYARQLGPSNEVVLPGNDTSALRRAHLAQAEKQWRDARDPSLTGVVAPHAKLTNAMVPFFRSAKTQNTNDGVKQTLLETYTGVNGLDSSLTGTYRRKTEVPAMFSPTLSAVQVTSGGSGGNAADVRDSSRFVPSVTQNNVRPLEQISVGPGVGVGPNVTSTDGFHPMLRILPKNVGGYKKTHLVGRVVPGAAAVNKAPTQGEAARVSVASSTGALVMEMDDRPPLPTMSAVLGTAQRPAQLVEVRGGMRPMEEDRFGNPSYRGAQEPRGSVETRVGYGGDNADRNRSLPPLNPSGASVGVGAFTYASHDRARLDAQQREAPGGGVGPATGPRANRASGGRVCLPPTQRDMTSRDYFGASGVSGGRGAQAVRPGSAPKDTMRERCSPGVFGAKGAVHGGAFDNVWRYKGLDRGSKKTVVDLRRVQPARVNVPQYVERKSVALRPLAAQATALPSAPSIRNQTYQQALGRSTTPHNKLPVSNPRLDLDMAAKQLSTNPYAQPSLWSMRG